MLISLGATLEILDKIGPARYLCLSKAEVPKETPTEYIQDAENSTVPLGI